jgi:hypothetical protein
MLLPPFEIIHLMAVQCGAGASKGDMKNPATL